MATWGSSNSLSASSSSARSRALTGGIKLEREKIRARRAAMTMRATQLRGVVGDMHQDIAKLKDRVRVLEKLVTDDDRRLADEIERLRRTDTARA